MSKADPSTRPGQEAPDAIGIIGLGNMGAAIGQRLAERGPVLGFRRTRKSALDGVTWAESLAEFRHLDQVILCLPSDMASREVCAELAQVLRPGALVIETSTVSAATVEQCARLLEAAQVRLVDAAVVGGVKAMRAGQSLLLIGGEAADIAAAEPVLRHLSQRRLVFGLRGSGMTAKIANNAVSHAVMVVLVEATALCQASGVDPEQFTELLADPGAGLTRPLTHRLRERVFEGNFAGGMSTANALKDSQLALEAAQQARVPLYAISGAHTAYEMAESRGLGDLDYAAIAQLWAEWIGRPLGPAGQAEPEGAVGEGSADDRPAETIAAEIARTVPGQDDGDGGTPQHTEENLRRFVEAVTAPGEH